MKRFLRSIIVLLLPISMQAMDLFQIRNQAATVLSVSSERGNAPNFSYNYSQQQGVVGQYWDAVRQQRPQGDIPHLDSMYTEFAAQHYLAGVIINEHTYRNALYQNLAHCAAQYLDHIVHGSSESALGAGSFFNELLKLAPENLRYQVLGDYEKIIFDSNGTYIGITNENRPELLKILSRFHRSFFTSEEDHLKILQRAAQTHPELRDLQHYSQSHKVKPYSLLDDTVRERHASSYIARYNHLSHLLKERKFAEAESYFEHCVNEVRDYRNKGLRRTRELYARMIGAPQLHDRHLSNLRKLLDNELRIEKERQSLPAWLRELEPLIKNSWAMDPEAAIELERCIQLALAKGDCADLYEKLSVILAHAISGDRNKTVLRVIAGQELSELQKAYERDYLSTVIDYCDYIAKGRHEYKKILTELIDIWQLAARPNSDIEIALATIFKHTDQSKPALASESVYLPHEATIETDFSSMPHASTQDQMRQEGLQLESVSTGRETVESRNYVSAMQKAVLEVRMIASGYAENSSAPGAQKIIDGVVQRVQSRSSQLEPYNVAESEGIIQQKLERRIELGMEELKQGAQELRTQEEVWNLFDRIIASIDSEFRETFPGMHQVAVEHFCHSLGLSTAINTWTTDDLLRAGQNLFHKNAANVKHSVTFIPQFLYSLANVSYDWLTGKRSSASILEGPAQLYYVWTSLSPYQQKTLVTKFLVDQALEAPSSMGMLKYGKYVTHYSSQGLKSIRQMMALGARSAVNRMESGINPLWLGLRNRLASIEHLKPPSSKMFTPKGFNEIIKYPESIKNYSNGRAIRTFSKLDFKKCIDHMFSENHIKREIDKLGSSRQAIVDKTIEVILEQDQLGALVDGTNTIALKLNGHDSIIKVHIVSGEVMSINLFKGTTNRVVGNFIHL